MTGPTDRRAARVLLVDDERRVLLLQGGDPSAPERGQWWLTPGGGLDAGEEPVQAAARELLEETGLRVPPEDLGEPVHQRLTEFRFDGADYRQSEHYFLLRVPSYEVDTSGPESWIDPGITGHRWWRLDELRATDEATFPEDLPELLDRVLA